MNKITSFFFSMLSTGILILIFALSIAYATFIENDYGTQTAKILIYNAKWFEGLLLLLCINLIGSVFKYELVSKKKWPILLFHVAFVVIALGAAITRYVGFEGNMHIREGQSSNTMVSTATYITVEARSGNQSVHKEKQVLFSPYTANRFKKKLELNGHDILVENQKFVSSASETLVIDPTGEPIVSILAVTQSNVRYDFNLRRGEIKKVDGITIGFEWMDQLADINLTMSDGTLYASSSDSLRASGMMHEDIDTITPGTKTEVNTQLVYSLNNFHFAVKQYLSKGRTQLAYTPAEQGAARTDALQTRVSIDGQSKELIVFGNPGTVGQAYSVQLNGVDVSVSYGSKIIELPFSIHLNDFQLERYPGSNSPSSYASEVVLIDGASEKPHRIFMNNILKYGGYRFFQSSYDTDEQGTILSVNNDSLGTSITYFGYLLMAIGMVLTLFTKQSRFKTLLRASSKLRAERKKFFAVLLLGVLFAFSASAQSQAKNDHVSEFGKLVTQSPQGRLEPVSTLASEILRKVAKKTSWEGMSPTEVFLEMQSNPEKWKNIEIIKVANPELRKQLGTGNNYVSFNSLVQPRELGGYKLSAMFQVAYEKKSNERNKLDKEIINVDERANILMNVFSGDFLTIFPVPGDDNHKWVSINQTTELNADNANFAKNTFISYFTSVAASDWATASQLLKMLKNNQQQFGAKVMPSKTKIQLEVLYNKWDIFGKLAKIFMFSGLILLFVQLTMLFNPRIRITRLKKIAFWFILILFAVETAGLAIRWYISDHAPWSNGYESMIFISWATCLGGLIFARRSEITLSLTAVLAGLTLMVAGMSWMSPEITNLVPVLKSYWLIVHVAIITASYGFLGISALLGFLNLVLMISRTKNNRVRVEFTIKELTNIIQIAMIIGLLMLTVGSFLGGVWANESWGRYWGWDPKETWALVTILVYTFIGHMHRIPGFKGTFAVSVGAVLGIFSVLMTYFGVNYYLSGLHSYAQGEPAPIPTGLYVAVAVVFMVIFGALYTDKGESELVKS